MLRKLALACLMAALILPLASVAIGTARERHTLRALAALDKAATRGQIADVVNGYDYRTAAILLRAQDASDGLCLLSVVAFAILWRVAGSAPVPKPARACLVAAIVLALAAIGFGLARERYASRMVAAAVKSVGAENEEMVIPSSDYRTAFLLEEVAATGGLFSFVSLVAAASFWKGGRTRGLGRVSPH